MDTQLIELINFYRQLFQAGVAAASHPILQISIANIESDLDHILQQRIRWRIKELPGDYHLQWSSSNNSFMRSIAQQYYNCFAFYLYPQKFINEDNNSLPICEHSDQIIIFDAICYDAAKLYYLVDRLVQNRALMQAEQEKQHGSNNEPKQATADNELIRWTNISNHLKNFIYASPLTVLRDLIWPSKLSSYIWQTIINHPALNFEVASYLAFADNSNLQHKHADEIVNYLLQYGFTTFVDQINRMRKHYRPGSTNIPQY